MGVCVVWLDHYLHYLSSAGWKSIVPRIYPRIEWVICIAQCGVGRPRCLWSKFTGTNEFRAQNLISYLEKGNLQWPDKLTSASFHPVLYIYLTICCTWSDHTDPVLLPSFIIYITLLDRSVSMSDSSRMAWFHVYVIYGYWSFADRSGQIRLVIHIKRFKTVRSTSLRKSASVYLRTKQREQFIRCSYLLTSIFNKLIVDIIITQIMATLTMGKIGKHQ